MNKNNRLLLNNSIKEKLANVHPGEILYYEFLEPLKISAYQISKEITRNSFFELMVVLKN